MGLINTIKLKDKFLLTIISIFVLVFLLFSFILIKFEEKLLIENATNQAGYLVKAMGLNLTNCLSTPSSASCIKKIIAQLQTDKNIANIMIVDRNDNIVFRTNSRLHPTPNRPAVLQFQSILDATSIRMVCPLISNDQNLGTLWVDYSLENARTKLAYFKYFIIIAAFLGLVIAILAAQTMAKMVTRQIDLLHQSLDRVNSGNYSHKVPIIANDELGDLAKAFNTLFINLKDSYKDSYIKTKNLLSKKNMLDAILSNLNEGVIVTDQAMRIRQINNFAEETFDVFAGMVIGEPVKNIAKNPEYLEQLQKFTQDNLLQADFTLCLNTSEQPKTYKVSLIRAVNEYGEIIGIISVFMDITKEYQINEMKTNLLQIVSHELKTPLVSIIGFIDMVLKDTKNELADTHFEYLGIAKTSAEQLKNMVNNILNLSKLQTRQLDLERNEFSIRPLIDEIVSTFKPQLEQKNLQINTSMPENDLTIYTDKEKIRQVLINLLSNAIKFTNQGTIFISAGLDKTPGFIRFIISDTGIGISRDHLPEIFDRFKQLDVSLSRNFEGAGLGLAIVKEIITLLGGSIEVASEVGKGSSFSIILPLNRNADV